MPVIPFRPPRAPKPFTVEAPPVPSRRAGFVRWLRKMHGWIGLWGAVLGLLFGITGIVLNHRAVLRIPAVQTQEASLQVPLPASAAANPLALGAWLKQSLRAAQDPVGNVAPKLRVEPGRPVPWGDHSLVQPARWSATFSAPSGRIEAEYWVGNHYVTVKRMQNNAFGTLVNLHKGVGMSAAWILLVDTLAGSIILLSLSGVTLWMLTHKRRTVGIVIGAVSLLAVGGLALASL